MKVKIIDDNNIEVAIDPRSIMVNGKTLDAHLKEFNKMVTEVRKFKEDLLRREKGLLKSWQEIQ